MVLRKQFLRPRCKIAAKNGILLPKLFWPVWINCSSDLKNFANSWPFLTAILHRGLRNCFFYLCISVHLLSIFSLDLYIPFLFGLLFPFSISTFLNSFSFFFLFLFQFFFIPFPVLFNFVSILFFIRLPSLFGFLSNFFLFTPFRDRNLENFRWFFGQIELLSLVQL